MKFILLSSLCTLLLACNGSNSFLLLKVIDGNTIQLSNGVIVKLKGVQKNPQNVPVLDHYLAGPIVFLNAQNEEIDEFTSDHIEATAFNNDGDDVNKLLVGVSEVSSESPVRLGDAHRNEKIVIKLSREDGVILVPITINGEDLSFIFDTGASLISISSSTAQKMLDEGRLQKGDFIGKGDFTDATGKISEGLIINLRMVKIGSKILQNIQACVSSSQNAPLLFGQSAMQRFGKLSIDYDNNEITFD